MESPLTTQTARLLLATGNPLFPFGPRNAELRQQVLFDLGFGKVPKSKATSSAVRNALDQAFQLPNECEAVREDAFRAILKKQVASDSWLKTVCGGIGAKT